MFLCSQEGIIRQACFPNNRHHRCYMAYWANWKWIRIADIHTSHATQFFLSWSLNIYGNSGYVLKIFNHLIGIINVYSERLLSCLTAPSCSLWMLLLPVILEYSWLVKLKHSYRSHIWDSVARKDPTHVQIEQKSLLLQDFREFSIGSTVFNVHLKC